MIEDRIGYRYAKSLFDLSKEKNILEEVHQDMNLIHNTCEGSPDLVAFLESPLIGADKKREAVKSIFGDKVRSQVTQLLLDMIIQKNREMYLDNVAKAFVLLYDIERKIQRGELISAMPLSPEVVAQVKAMVEQKTGKQFEITTKIDESIIGGFILKVGDRLFDGSIASRLSELSHEFRKNQYIREY